MFEFSQSHQRKSSVLSKMACFKLYFSPSLLLLVLACPLWQVSQSVPVMSQGPLMDSCVFYAQTLLQNITETLTQKNLFSGMDCSQQSVEMNTETSTATVCTPTESTCVKSEFNQELCLTNINEDLHHYYKFLSAQPDPDNLLGRSVLLSLRELMENCFQRSLPSVLASVETTEESFEKRLSLCKVLKGFYVRIITINRVISYIHSGEHTQ
ncbi:uncharacterized protein zmp:0000001127 [Labrus mixtus]|uniref:uncharacterized protein zmp:0000001127 n=1 Tax=Labrus mixtus TaxID=508554 RepID=UPI0029C080C7|nr:uncharacterized protein zmp:0000001127 [Labrus mixtus]